MTQGPGPRTSLSPLVLLNLFSLTTRELIRLRIDGFAVSLVCNECGFNISRYPFHQETRYAPHTLCDERLERAS